LWPRPGPMCTAGAQGRRRRAGPEGGVAPLIHRLRRRIQRRAGREGGATPLIHRLRRGIQRRAGRGRHRPSSTTPVAGSAGRPGGTAPLLYHLRRGIRCVVAAGMKGRECGIACLAGVRTWPAWGGVTGHLPAPPRRSLGRGEVVERRVGMERRGRTLFG
jgi:hypothetical protein